MSKHYRISLCFILVIVCNMVFLSYLRAQESNKSWEDKYQDELYVYQLIEEVIDVKSDYSYEKNIHNIIEIQKEGAKDTDIGEIVIDYNSDHEKIKNIKAFIIKENGKRLSVKSIQDLSPYSGEPMYSNNRVKVISMPEVLPGNTIDYKARTYVNKPFMPANFCKIFTVSKFMPVKALRYQLRVPKEMKLNIRNQNTDLQPKIETDKKKIIYTWSLENVDKFETEDEMPPLGSILSEIQVSTLRNWQEIDGWYDSLVKRNLKVTAEMKNKVQELTAGSLNEGEKAQSIIKYIQDNFRYVSMSFGEHNYEPHSAGEVFYNKYGDCKDQTIVAIAMLKEAGISAYPCFFYEDSYSDTEISDKVPMPLYFNHVILGIELEPGLYFTDLLIKGYKFSDTPADIQGSHLLVINGQGGSFCRLPILGDSTFRKSDIVINSDGSALVTRETQLSKDSSALSIEYWKNLTEKRKQQYIEGLNSRIAPGGKVLENKFVNIDKEYSMVTHIMKYEAPKWADMSGKFMTFNGKVLERYKCFTGKERTHPVWLKHNQLDKVVNTYHIPEGYSIENIPSDKELLSSFIEYSRKYSYKNNIITETDTLSQKRILLQPGDYQMIQDTYNKIPQLSMEKIIIKRKADR